MPRQELSNPANLGNLGNPASDNKRLAGDRPPRYELQTFFVIALKDRDREGSPTEELLRPGGLSYRGDIGIETGRSLLPRSHKHAALNGTKEGVLQSNLPNPENPIGGGHLCRKTCIDVFIVDVTL